MHVRALLAVAVALGCAEKPAPAEGEAPKSAASEAKAPEQPLVIYAGRSLSLVKPVIALFEKESGVTVKVRDGKSGELAALLLEEGAKSPADVFWAQDAGSLGQVDGAGLLAPLAAGVSGTVVAHFRGQSPNWVPITGRARVLAFAPSKIAPEALPTSIFDLVKPEYKGLVGWAPTNASFQAFVTAMRVQSGEEKTEAWLRGMMANEARRYPKNTPIIRALAAGEISLGLPNHYYLLREKKKQADYPIEQRFFADGDVGNLVNVAGAGALKSSTHPDAGRFIAFLLSPAAQRHFTESVLEYPVVDGVPQNPLLRPLSELTTKAPKFDLKALSDLKATRDLLRKVGLI